MGDRGIPKTWRHMNGYSSHTYMWVNAKGQKFWVKYHFKTNQGIDFLTQEEADRLAGVDGDYHTRDLLRRSSAATTRVGLCTCRSCRSTRPRPIDSTRSI